MKKLLATTAFIASLATSAFAMGPVWNHSDINYPLGPWYGGNTYGAPINMGCVFTGTTRGTMVYDEDEAEWNISMANAAVVQIEHRGIHSISVESDGNIFRGGAETHARSEVDYYGSVAISIDADAIASRSGGVLQDGVYDLGFDGIDSGHDTGDAGEGGWEAFSVWQTMLYVLGKAKMVNGSDDLLGGKNNYNIRHTVTCLM